METKGPCVLTVCAAAATGEQGRSEFSHIRIEIGSKRNDDESVRRSQPYPGQVDQGN